MKIKINRNDVVYASIMILMIVFGFVGGTLVQLGHSANQCNEYFNDWVDSYCKCSEEIRDEKIMMESYGLYNFSDNMEVPQYEAED